jgi:hypothetical protein
MLHEISVRNGAICEELLKQTVDHLPTFVKSSVCRTTK